MIRLAHQHAMTLLLATVLLACCGTSAWGQSTLGDRFLAGLRERRLLSLAETYCLKRLSDSSLPDAERAALTAELSRCFAEHALQSAPAAAEPLWQQALAATNDFSRDHPDHPSLVLIRVQGALVLLARGEWLRQQAEVVREHEQLPNEARAQLRMAVRELVEAEKQIADRLRQPPARRGDVAGVSRDELLSLQGNVRYQAARAFRNQAQCYPASSADRANALSQALELLAPLAQRTTGEPLVWQSKLDEITCLRLMHDYAACARQLEQLAQAQPPESIISLARAEEIRLALDQSQIDKAITIARAIPADQHRTAELDFACLEAVTAAWRAADHSGQVRQAKQWEEQFAGIVRSIESRHGPYWTRRAEALLASSAAAATQSSSLTLLVKAAHGHWHNGEIDAALTAYDRAREQAEREKLSDQAFQLGYTAATIEHERKRHRQAADRYRQLAVAISDHEQAGEAHLLAIFNVAQDAKSREPVDLTEYRQLLEEHLRIWPGQATAGQARWLTARLLEQESDWPGAIQAYSQIPRGQARSQAAIDATLRCYERWLAETRRSGGSAQEISLQAAKHFESLLASGDQPWPERWTQADLTAATSAAQMWLAAAPPDSKNALKVLEAALANSAAAPEVWQANARGLRIAALAGESQFAEAAQEIESLAAASPAVVESLLARLAQISATASPTARGQLAELQVAIARLLPRDQAVVVEPGKQDVRLIQAEALATSGRITEALELYETLAKQYPAAGQIQEEYANLLLKAGGNAALETALAKWREIEIRSRTGTPRWFRARYHLAKTFEKLGDQSKAAHIVNLTRGSYPQLGGEDLKADFLSLLERCGE